MERDIMTHLMKYKWRFPQHEEIIKMPDFKFNIRKFDGRKKEIASEDVKIVRMTDEVFGLEARGRKKHMIEIEYNNDIRPSTILIECEVRDKIGKEPDKIITKHVLKIYCASLEECGITAV